MEKMLVVHRAVRLAIAIRDLAKGGWITRSRARLWIDNLALRMDREGEYEAHERVSAIYMNT